MSNQQKHMHFYNYIYFKKYIYFKDRATYIDRPVSFARVIFLFLTYLLTYFLDTDSNLPDGP